MMGRCRKKIMDAIADEFGEAFWDVVKGFAKMGYSQRSTAFALGISYSFFHRLIKDYEIEIEWSKFIDGVIRRQWRENIKTPGTFEYFIMERARDKQRKFLEYQGRRQSVTQWAEEKGINKYTLHKRLQAGWPIAKALETPVGRGWRSGRPPKPRADHPWSFRPNRTGEGGHV